MARITQKAWRAVIDGTEHNFTLDSAIGLKGRFTLSADGRELLTSAYKWSGGYVGYDLPFTLDGKELRLIISANGKKIDLVADGKLLSNGKAYVATPKWIWVFIVPIIPLAVLGGAIGALCGLAGFAVSLVVSKTPLPVIARVLLCILVTAVFWGLYLVILAALLGGVDAINNLL